MSSAAFKDTSLLFKYMYVPGVCKEHETQESAMSMKSYLEYSTAEMDS